MRVRSFLAVSAIVVIPSYASFVMANDGFEFGQVSATEKVEKTTVDVVEANTPKIEAQQVSAPENVTTTTPEVVKSPVQIAQNAASEEDDALARAQAAMNNEVLSKPFLAARPEEVDAYIKEAMAKNLKPEEYKGTHWKSGYTCNDLLRYSWREYRNCSYYHRYHGRYYW